MRGANSEKNRNRRVPAVDRAVRVMKLLGDGEGPLGVSELSRRLEVNKSTLHAILNTLSYHNLLARDERDKTYRIGSGLYALSNRVQGPIDLRATARPFIEELAKEVDETVLLGIFQDEHVVVLDHEEAPHDLRISARVGQRMPFCSGVFGQVLCAAMSKTELEVLVRRQGLRAFTKNSAKSLPAFRQVLVQVRKRGYASEEQEFLVGVSAVGSPVVNAKSQVVAALSIVGLSARLTQARLADLGQIVRRSGEDISRQLGATAYPAWNGLA